MGAIIKEVQRRVKSGEFVQYNFHGARTKNRLQCSRTRIACNMHAPMLNSLVQIGALLLGERIFVNLMRTVRWNSEFNAVEMIDQRLLPGELRISVFHTHGDVALAITNMIVRGAPAIGAAAAFGMVLAGKQSEAVDDQVFLADLEDAAEILRAARPTASNLNWAVDRMLQSAKDGLQAGSDDIRELLLEEAQQIADEDIKANRQMGKHGAALLPQEGTIIHHCNTGALATVDYGTALGVIRSAHESGKKIHVLVDETRPRLQGSRLTAWELDQLQIPFEIIADNAAGSFMASGEVSAVLVGADRVAANGDVANKIGTYMLALAAKDNAVPFYVAMPASTIDLRTRTGKQIPIEERDSAEVLNLLRDGLSIAPKNSRARNPAFDITPHRLVTAFITEVGVISPPYEEGLRNVVKIAQS